MVTSTIDPISKTVCGRLRSSAHTLLLGRCQAPYQPAVALTLHSSLSGHTHNRVRRSQSAACLTWQKINYTEAALAHSSPRMNKHLRVCPAALPSESSSGQKPCPFWWTRAFLSPYRRGCTLTSPLAPLLPTILLPPPLPVHRPWNGGAVPTSPLPQPGTAGPEPRPPQHRIGWQEAAARRASRPRPPAATGPPPRARPSAPHAMTQPIRTAGLSPSPSPAPAARTRAAAGPQSRCNPPPFSRYGHRPAPRRPPPSPRLRSVPRPPSNTHRKPAGPCAQARPGQPRGRPPPPPCPALRQTGACRSHLSPPQDPGRGGAGGEVPALRGAAAAGASRPAGVPGGSSRRFAPAWLSRSRVLGWGNPPTGT